MTRRERYNLPADMETALEVAGVRIDYDARPAYQRNDYIGWVTRAKTSVTRSRRIEQMLNELRRGGVYMGMEHPPSRKERREEEERSEA